MLDIAVPQITATTSEPSYGSYDIEPLEAGFGQTLGNALRRVLLSSLSGAAVTSVRIDGVKHEFQDIPGVKEDVTDIVLNVKKLRLRSFSDRPVTMRLEVNGERETVTAADVEVPSTVEIVNPEQVICTIDEADAHLDMELVVETGKGYVPAESKDDQPIGQIPVDAIFTPVVRVNYTVEHTRVGQMTNYDKIILQIWTDGTITPDQAIRQAANILVTHFGMIAGFGTEDKRIEPGYDGVGAVAQLEPGEKDRGGTNFLIPQRIYDMAIEELDLSVRAYNCLKRSNITRVGQVLTMNRDDLLAVRNFGEKSLTELEERLLERHLLPQVDPGDEQDAVGDIEDLGEDLDEGEE